MGLSPQDIQYLEELSEMYRLGQLSEAAFKHASGLVLTKSSKDLSPTTAQNSKNSRTPRPSTISSKQDFNSTAPRLTAVAKSGNAAPAETNFENSFPNVFHSKRVTATVSTRPSAIITETQLPRKRQATDYNLISMRDTHRIQKASIATTFLTIAAATVALLSTAKSTPLELLTNGTASLESTALALAGRKSSLEAELGKSIRPRFGSSAVQICKDACPKNKAQSSQMCARGCERLSLVEFGRRVTSRELDPRHEANKIIESCSDSAKTNKKNSHKDWAENIESALGILNLPATTPGKGTFSSARNTYSNLATIHQSLGLPAGDNEARARLTREILSSSCLRAHLALAELGAITAQENDDSFSRRFYQSLWKELEQDTQKASSRLRNIISNNESSLGFLSKST